MDINTEQMQRAANTFDNAADQMRRTVEAFDQVADRLERLLGNGWGNNIERLIEQLERLESPAPEVDNSPRIETLVKDTRLLNSLTCEGVHTLQDLRRVGMSGVIKMPNIGKASIKKLEESLASHGLTLGYGGVSI